MSSITFLAFGREAALDTHALLRKESASMFSSWVSISVSNRDTVPELAAVLSNALLPTAALIAGSRESPSWINKSRTPHYAKHKHKPSRREASDEKTLCRDLVPRNCVGDEGRPLGASLQGQAPNHRERRQ